MESLLGSAPPPALAGLRPPTPAPEAPRWEGGASQAAAEKSRQLNDTRHGLYTAHHRAQVLIDHAGQVITKARLEMRGVQADWERDKAAIAPFASRPEGQAALAASGQLRLSEASHIITTTTENLNTVAGNVHQLTGRIPLAPPTTPGAPADPSIPARNASVDDVKRWWESLTQEDKDRLLLDWPEKLGALDGIPVVDRGKANATIMQRDIDRPTQVAKSRGVTEEEVLAHPERYGMAGPMMDRYHNALKAKEALADTSNKTGAPTFLQVYEPEAFSGDGRAAIAIGDPDHAATTAVVVPGTGNSVENGWLAKDDAINLYNEMADADPTRSRSVLAWMGYDAPDSPIDPRIGTTALAHEGGQLLAADVNALNATHVGAGQLTVMGHSYGSTTVADAAAGYGMHTDNVVLVGSPGTDMARNAADFHLNTGGHLYVGAASSDPVTQLGTLQQTPVPGTGWSVALGPDPALDGYGSTRFKAEVPGLTSPLSDHSQYYKPGSESLYSMADIASGHGQALAGHEMTARHRIPALSNIPVLADPETYRVDITSDNFHAPN